MQKIKALFLGLLLLCNSHNSKAQERIEPLRFKPPFAGLNLKSKITDLATNEFSRAQNIFFNERGEIVARGLFTLNVNGANTAIAASNNLSGVQQLYRFYRNTGSPILLAYAHGGQNPSFRYGTWFWYNDTLSRWYYRQPFPLLCDTLTQLDYGSRHTNTLLAITNGSKKATSLSAHFYERCTSNGFVIYDSAGSSVSPANEAFSNYDIVNDTILWLATSAAKATGGYEFEVIYKSASGANASSADTSFYVEAISYRDTIYFSNSIFDPMTWDGKQTRKANIVYSGQFNNIKPGPTTTNDTLFDSSRVWVPNSLVGLWLVRTKLTRTANAGTYNGQWKTIYFRIIENAEKWLRIIADTVYNNTELDYSIVSLPIDEPFRGTLDSSFLASNFVGGPDVDTVVAAAAAGAPSLTDVLRSPLTLFGVAGMGRNQIVMITSADSTVSKFTFQDQQPTVGFSNTTRYKILRSRAPIPKFLKPWHDRMLWVSDTLYPSSFWWSQPGTPGLIYPNDFLGVNPIDGEKINGVWVTSQSINFGKGTRIYGVFGNDPTQFVVIQLSVNVGVDAAKSIIQSGEDAWFYDWPRGFFHMQGASLDTIPISENIQVLVDSINSAATQNISGTLLRTPGGEVLIWSVPFGSSTKPNRLLVYSLRSKAWSTWVSGVDAFNKFTSSVSFNGTGDDGNTYFGLADSLYVVKYLKTGATSGGRLDYFDGQGTPATSSEPVTDLESGRYGLPDRDIRVNDVMMVGNTYDNQTGGSATAFKLDIIASLSGSSPVSTLTFGVPSSGVPFDLYRALSSQSYGSYLGWRIQDNNPSDELRFEMKSLDLIVRPWGRRLPR